MPKARRPSQEHSSPLRRIIVSDADIAAAQKLLEVLVKIGRAGADDLPLTPTDVRFDREAALRRAREACELRERRLHAFDFSAEGPFLLLVALYVNEEWEPLVTLTRLAQLAWVSHTTSIRWLDLLVSNDLIERRGDAEDGRKILISLTPKGRAKMDELFK